MNFTDLAVPLERVPCDVCHHDIPLSEAVVAEATDYVVYFCGLACYDRWRRRRDTDPSRPAAS